MIARTIGGHPRLIEFVDALLRHGRHAVLREVTEKLRGLAREHHIDLTVGRDLAQAVTDAVRAGSRDIVLVELLDLLTVEQREVLLQAAVSIAPIDVTDLAVARHGENVTDAQRKDVLGAADRLVGLTLLTAAGVEGVVVHPWVGEALLAHQGPAVAGRHERAAQMRIARINTGRAGFDDLVEVARHLAAIQRYDDLAAYALSAADAGLGEVSVAALLGEILRTLPTDHAGYLSVARTPGRSAAQQRQHRRGPWQLSGPEPDRGGPGPGRSGSAKAQRDLSVSHNSLGELMVAVGDSRGAERYYRDELAIAQRLAPRPTPATRKPNATSPSPTASSAS